MARIKAVGAQVIKEPYEMDNPIGLQHWLILMGIPFNWYFRCDPISAGGNNILAV
jgi:hypothetical protein